MQKSIFKRYFTITAVIILISVTLLAGILVFFLRSMWISEKNKLLVKNVNLVVSVAEDGLGYPNYWQEMSDVVVLISQTINADIYMVNAKGQYFLCADRTGTCSHKNMQLSDTILEQSLQGRYSELGTMGGTYREKYYTVGAPMKSGSEAVGVVYASVPASDLDQYLLQILKAMLICSIVVLMLAFLAVYVATAQMTKPLRLMAQAAENMEKGNFMQRIPVEHRDEIGLLAEAFNRMAKSLASLEQMRRSFISSVSHELKTPMTTISGFIDGILDGTIDKENEEKYLKIVSEETKRLSRLVNSMLQMSRLESDEYALKRKPFNLTDVVARTILSFEKRIDEKQLKIVGLEDASDVMLNADRDMIYQVVYNLVENAIKFTPQGGRITTLVETRKDGNVHFHIRNSGQGLSAVELSRIFERFYKTDRSRSEDKTGMGFGLYIVKTIVGQHGGQITAGSVEGEYTCFDVVLPNPKPEEWPGTDARLE